MKTMKGNVEFELKGTLMMIRRNGSLVRAMDLNPLTAVDDYQRLVRKFSAQIK